MNLKSMSMGGLYNTYEIQQNNDGSLVHFTTYDRNKAYWKRDPKLHFEIK